VSGRKDGNGGEYVRAVVALRRDMTEHELIAHCRGELEDFKLPRKIEFRAELVRLPSGKLDPRG
jgi:acyl-CoA synthetase (AMP-forming)/AMP-acid ligase II